MNQDRLAWGLSRRGFLGGLGGAAAMGGVGALAADATAEKQPADEPVKSVLPPGKPLVVQPVVVYSICQRQERTSWRVYGAVKTKEDVAAEAKRIEGELAELAARAEFPVEFLPVVLVNSEADAAKAADSPADLLLVFPTSGDRKWLETMVAKKHNIVFLRHKSGPIYLWYEITHWYLLRKTQDVMAEPNLSTDDVVVDEYDEVLWRLRAMYGVKNTRGTKMLAFGGMQAYSVPGQERGPDYGKSVWGFTYQTVPDADLVARVAKARADAELVKQLEAQTDALLAQPGVTLGTERRFVVNSFLAIKVFKDLLQETGATNVGVANCMGSLIGLLDTPPCLAIVMLNDEGYTAFCHTDVTHTAPGVLMRWISGKPSFVCNSHYPHHGLMTLAHCAAPRRMNGRDFEPTTILTHYESDYGAATKIEYRRGQTITCVVPNLHCTKWFGYRAAILDSPAYEACRSQMNVAIDGDWRRLREEIEGFHTVVTYGDYLREVGYAIKRLPLEWHSFSPVV